MKDITVKNENGVEINAKVMSVDELLHEWKRLLPGLPFYAWLGKLEECGIVTKREFCGMRPADFIVKSLESSTATVETDGLYHYEIHGSRAKEAAERMEQKLDLLSRSVEHGIINSSSYLDELSGLRQSIEREFSVSIKTVAG